MTLLSRISAVVIIVISVAFVTQGIRSARRTNESRAAIQLIADGIRNYESAYTFFPPPHANSNSWRVRILPMLYSNEIYDYYNFSLPWDDSHNVNIHALPIERKWAKDGEKTPYGIPYPYAFSSDMFGRVAWKRPITATRIMMFVGEHGFGDPQWTRKQEDFVDSLETTLMIAEVVVSDTHWLQPKDLNTDRMDDLIYYLGLNTENNPLVAFADGFVCKLRHEIPRDVLNALATIDGRESISRELLLRNHWIE